MVLERLFINDHTNLLEITINILKQGKIHMLKMQWHINSFILYKSAWQGEGMRPEIQ